jgi:hypothetical protein
MSETKRLVCERGHEVTCDECARIDHQAAVLDRDRALAHRPGAVFARMHGNALHTADCQYVVHPDLASVDDETLEGGQTYAIFITREEAAAWLGQGSGYRDRHRCRICSPDIPESPETKAGGWSHRREPPAEEAQPSSGERPPLGTIHSH